MNAVLNLLKKNIYKNCKAIVQMLYVPSEHLNIIQILINLSDLI